MKGIKMKDQRDAAIKHIGEDGIRALNNDGLIVVARDERDNIVAQLGSISVENTILKTQIKNNNKSDIIKKITAALQADETDILSKIQQMQNALKSITSMPVGEAIEKKSIVAAKEAINDTTVITSPVIKERRTSVYVPPKTTISTNKRIVRMNREVPNVVTKKSPTPRTSTQIGNIKNH